MATPLPRAAGVLTSLVRADGLLVVPAGVEGHHAGEQVRVELLRGLADIERTIVAIGSHDLVLDLAASGAARGRPADHPGVVERRVAGRAGRAARRAVPPGRLASARPGDRRVHAAVPGPDLRRGRRAGRGPAGAPRPGSAGRPRQPAGADRHRRPHPARPALRQPPARRRHPGAARPASWAGWASTRPPSAATPARSTPTSAVAAAVAAGRADTGLGIQAAARAFGLDFVPVAARALRPRAARRRRWTTSVLAPLWALLEQPDFRTEVEKLGGYSCAETGRRIR